MWHNTIRIPKNPNPSSSWINGGQLWFLQGGPLLVINRVINPYRVFFTPVKTQLFSVIYRGYPFCTPKTNDTHLAGLFGCLMWFWGFKTLGFQPPWKQWVDLYNYHCWTLKGFNHRTWGKNPYSILMVGKEAQGKGSFFFLASHLGKYMNILPAPKNSQKDIPQYPHFWLLELQQKNHEKPGITSTLHGSPTAPLQHTPNRVLASDSPWESLPSWLRLFSRHPIVWKRSMPRAELNPEAHGTAVPYKPICIGRFIY